ncbi:hypothetical protein N865_00290 [Intrasporangium oryzae NRRL B-24470]|uniref:Uncharacterized protein n=1 Tax=Intrasporangium oryzae NRRL B-24470 TaxID=1386089 RepID=W9GE66_9MICO|nr:hypothetical protein [Intrasporangium oryzae]EWT02164.1 hypothetical protein N865_00290 [Intrasporangium oryzae NRRL B-24470]
MGPGVTLAVLGAILTFAVRANTPNINLPVVGIILMIAGGALIANARRGRRERVITRVRPGNSTMPSQTVRETIREVDGE